MRFLDSCLGGKFKWGWGRQTKLDKLTDINDFWSKYGALIDGGFRSSVLCGGILNSLKEAFLEIFDLMHIGSS